MSESDEKSDQIGIKVPYNLKNLVDSDSSDDEIGRNQTNHDESVNGKKSRKILSSSESENEENNEELEEIEAPKVDRRKNKNPKKKNLDEKKTRKSAKKAMEIIQEKVKTQTKLDSCDGPNDENDSHERESREIRIPYHKPRQFTFKEFMARRTINKPTDKKETDKSTIKSIKEVKKNIEAFAQKMKEREEEAIEFFRSESEEEDEKDEVKIDVKKNDEEITETIETVEKLPEEIEEIPAPIEIIPPETKSLEEKKLERLQMLKEKYGVSLEIKPKISLDPGSVIDLETGQVKPKELSGPEKLREKFLGTQPKLKQIKLTDMKSKLQYEIDHHRPGKGREILMESLIEKVNREKIEEMKKRTETFKEMHEIEYEPEEKPENVEDDEGDDEECEEEEEPEENDIIIKDKKRVNCDLFDGEAEDDEDNENDEDSDEDEESSSSEEEEEIAPSNEPRKSRIIKAFEDSDDEEKPTEQQSEAIFNTEDLSEVIPSSEKDETDFLSTQSSFKMPSVSEDFQVPEIPDFNDDVKVTQTIEDDDLMDICSGQFAPTQLEAPIKMTQNEEFDDFVSQVEETPDLVFSSAPIETEKIEQTPILNPRKILESSDDEENCENRENLENRVKKLKKKKKKLLKRLGFSDSEDEETNDVVAEAAEEEEFDEEICEEEEVCVDYDSEENEIEVKLTKKEKVKKATNFLENEADLSGSEWGSADEDERGLDKYDIEVGDEDEFDQTKLREEVGAIHARKVLDEDIKKVKKIQDILLDDEEEDGANRERKFRWKNQTDGFDVNNENAMDPDAAADDSEEDGESEIAWRKMRHERETFLKEISESQSNTASETRNKKILIFDQNSQTVTETDQNLICKKKLEVRRASEIVPKSSEKFSSSSFLIKTVDMKRYSSSSFLSRDQETLNRIAKFVSHKDDEITMSSTGNSMSFVMLDKPDESKKRKSDGNQAENSKKRKLDKNPSRPFLLDQLK